MTDYSTPRLETWRRWTDGPLLVLAIGSLPLLLLELERHKLTYADRIFLDVVNVALLVAFAVDYIVELALASPRKAYIRGDWTSLLIVVSQALALIPGLAATGSLRALRAGRGIRVIAVVFRLVAIGGASTRQGRALVRKHAARFALGFAGLTWITAAVGFTLAEDVGEHGRVHSFADALWWSAATMTTLGAGEIGPETAVGRMIALSAVLVGLTAGAIVTAKVAEFLVRTGREDAAAADQLSLEATGTSAAQGPAMH
jgi:voltage-gated potassium channel